MKKVLSLCLAIVLSFALLPTAAFAVGSPVVDSGSLNIAIHNGHSSLRAVEVSEDGTGVYTSRKWITPVQRDAAFAVLVAAEAVLATATTQEELDAALAQVNTAIALLESQKKPGLKPLPTIKAVTDAISAISESDPNFSEVSDAFQLFKAMAPKEQLKLPLASLEKLERLFLATSGLSPATTELEDNGYPAPIGFTVIGAILAACEGELPSDTKIRVLGTPYPVSGGINPLSGESKQASGDIKMMIDFQLLLDGEAVAPSSVIYYTMELPGSLPSNRIYLAPIESDGETRIPFVPLAGNKIRFAFAADEFAGVSVYLLPAPSTGGGGGDSRSDLTFPNLHVVGDEPETGLAPAEIPNPSTGGGSPVPMASMAVLLAVLAGAGAWMKRGR